MTQGMATALCPGSFDPPTNGHLDVIERAEQIFARVVVSVIDNPAKEPLFDAAQRVSMLSDLTDSSVDSFGGLLVDHARDVGADVVVKGVRTVEDFEAEMQMAHMNRRLSGVETLLMPAAPELGHISSSLVKEIARLGGSVADLVPPAVETALKERFE